MVEKLAKALEGLKNIQFTTSISDSNISKKEKMFFCVLAADIMVSLKTKNAQNLQVVIENMINLCDDKDSDVRMVADESLNRIITSLSHSDMLKVQVDLHGIIKKNGPARCLRAALTRFGQLSHYIRPNKGKAHVQTLIPALIEITKREEESIHETLASSIENIFKILGVFVKDNLLKDLIKAFLHNLSSNNPVIRRCSASAITTVVQYCRKPVLFNCFLLNSLLDCVIPICEENSTELILGVLGCLRLLWPTLICVKSEEGISGSFGLRKKQDEPILSIDRLIQTYELCLHYTNSKDHNVVGAALETLHQVLQNPPQQLESLLQSPAGFSRSYIHSAKENRLWSRSGSEMSVTFSLPAMEETLLFDENDATSQLSSFSVGETLELKQSLIEDVGGQSDDVKIVENLFREKALGGSHTLDADSDTESVATSDSNVPTNFLMRIETEEKEVEECSRSNSQDDLYSPSDSDKINCLSNLIDVGSFTDAAVPLIHCARHLAGSFLLDGAPGCLKTDRTVRVSVKSLALSCLSAVLKLYPVAMTMNLAKNQTELCTQEISDVLLYSDHTDPQIRGNVCLLVGSFMNSALVESKHFNSHWLDGDLSKFNSNKLLNIIFKGLQDKSAVCIRHALSAFKPCVNRALISVYNSQFLPVLEYLPRLTFNSYWLVKVKLAEVLSDLPYVCINGLNKSSDFQEEVIDSVLLFLLGDEDARVRSAAAEALVRIIPFLHCGKSFVLEYGKPLTEHLNNRLGVEANVATDELPFSLGFSPSAEVSFDENVEHALSLVVAKLSCSLLVPKTKHFLFGYLEALRLLSRKYPTTVFSKSWNCETLDTSVEGDRYLTSNLVFVVLSLFSTPPFALDLTAFSNATLLLGNLFAGHSFANLKTINEMSASVFPEEPTKLWDVFKNDGVSLLAEEILTHLLKVLNFYSHLVEEVTLSSVVESSSAANSFLPLLSPIKKQEKKSEEKTEEKKSKNVVGHKQSTQYLKLQQLLKNAYTNYKVSLNVSVGDKFLDLLQSTLSALSVLLEVATIQETGRCAEEILSYLRSVVSLRPKPAVICVIQLLKSLFGTNLVSGWEGNKLSVCSIRNVNLFEMLFHLPTKFLSDKISRRINSNSLELENLAPGARKPERKVVMKNSVKAWLGTYIRLFEPMIVKSQQLYTITGDVELQSNVLLLFNQLFRLRVNYCLLDKKQVFLDFVLKQFELIEHGQIPGVESLLPQIFRFLVLLSYEKQHSKPIMSIPKILQLCDGLMASDQPVETHCIPSLGPVVEDVFLYRSLMSAAEKNELETQREVLLSMLLRLVEFPEVMNMLSLILSQSKTIEGKEKWKRWSRQVIDVLLPLLNQDRLRIETLEGQKSFAKLVESLSPNALRPVNPVLKVLFVEPNDYNCQTSLKRWLAKVTVLLETVLFVKEDALLNRLEETHPNINLTTFFPSENLTLTDPFNVKSFFQTFEPSETVARFIFKVVSIVVTKINESPSSTLQLQNKLSLFFVCIFHILKSGTFHRITNSMQSVLVKEQDSLAGICVFFQKLSLSCPILTCHFSYFLTLLSYCDQNYWAEILVKPRTLAGKLVQSSGVISLSDYLCDNMSDTETVHFLIKNCFEELIVYSHEIPVKELFVTLHRKKSEWVLLLETVSGKNFESCPPCFVEKLLRLLELTESSHSGLLLKLIVDKFLDSPRLALSLLASSIACRQVEYLLTLPKEKVTSQMDGDTFKSLLGAFKKEKYRKRYSTLYGLLDKLRLQVFDSSTVHPSASSGDQMEEKRKGVELEEDWYFALVQQRCCQKGEIGDEVPRLLINLSLERILEIMFSPQFNVNILKTCLLYSQTLKQKHEELDSGSSLFNASRRYLLHMVNEIQKEMKETLKSSDVDAADLEKFSSSECFFERIWVIADCLAVFLDFVSSNSLEIGDDSVEGIVETMFLCGKILEVDIRRENIHPRYLETGLKCCNAALKCREIRSRLTRENCEVCISSLYHIVSHLVPSCRFGEITRGKDSPILARSDEINFLFNFVNSATTHPLLPDFLMIPIRDLVVGLCRMPALSSEVLKVPESGEIQDIDLLKSFISRFFLIGWSTRQQFEEIWVALLSVLGLNTQGNVPVEENAFVVQASAVAVEGITTLLTSTMLDSGSKKLLHHGRDSLSMKNIADKLPVIANEYRKDESTERRRQFLDNLEILERDDRYTQGLLSAEYLWTAVKQISSQIDLYERHCSELSDIGLDLPSCIHLLIELYNQWIYQPSPDIKMVTSTLKSSVVISDLFTDIAQFQWLLNFCLRIDEVLIPEDTVVLPLVILGCSKAASIVLPEEETCAKIKKLMLRSKSFPCKISAVQGLLYLLQSYVVCYAVNHTALPPPGSTFQTEEANFVTNIVDTFLPVALDAVQEFRLKEEALTDEYERCHWSLVFYLLQHYHCSLGDLKDEFLAFIFTTLGSRTCPESITALLIRGCQRLLLTTVVDENFRDQLTKVSLEIISNNSLSIARHGLQLLSVLSFLDKRVKDIRQLVTGEEDPEQVLRDMEKINVLFEKLKRSYPKEAEVVGEVISYVLKDFTASDVLTKVIQEFLSSHQPHQKILAGLLFKVFERAERSLVEDWIVFSLPSFVQGLPISMSIWTLNCFFVSASTEPWLRALFPLVQARIRMAEVEDKRLLCLSASRFYKQLKLESQKKSFLETFQKATTVDCVFIDLLSAIS